VALVLLAKGDPAGAEVLSRQASAIEAKVFGDQHDEYAQSFNTVGLAVEQQGRLAEAQGIFAECLRIGRAQLPADHPRLATYLVNLSRVRIARGDAAATESGLREALRLRTARMRADDWRIGQAQSLLAAALAARGQREEAEALMLAADRLMKPVTGAQGLERAANRARLAALYRATGRAVPAALAQ
jgi:hypothetical protein